MSRRSTLSLTAAMCAALLTMTACSGPQEKEATPTTPAAPTTTTTAAAAAEVDRTEEVSSILTGKSIPTDNLTGAFERSGRLELETSITEGNKKDANTQWGIDACQAVVDALNTPVLVREADKGIFATNVKPASQDGTCTDY